MNSLLSRAVTFGLLQLLLVACGGGGSDSASTPGTNTNTNPTASVAPDTTPPTVVSVTPANGLMGIAQNTTVSVNFSELVSCATVTGSSVTLTSNGNAVAGAVACSGSSATFTPATSLPLAATYTLSIASSVKDTAGNALSSEFTSTFLTAATASVSQYTVNGTLAGLNSGRGVALQLNGSNTLSLTSAGAFSFATNLTSGAAYNVAVLTQPNEQTCVVSNGTGTVTSNNIIDVAVTCVTNTYTINGSLTGLGAGKTVTVQNNGADDVTFTGNGALTFRSTLPALSAYNVTVSSQPVGQTCVVTNGSGILGTSNVINIAIACSNNNYNVGGTVTGLVNGNSLTLQNNGGNNLVVTSSGNFNFATAIVTGGTYNVTVSTNPQWQSCSVSNSSGSVAGNDITSIAVACSPIAMPIAATLNVAYDLKKLKFSWSGASNVDYYKLMSTPDGTAPYVQVGNDLTASNVDVDITVHLIDWVNARYRVDACNLGGCVASIDIAAAGAVAGSVGYFKASNTDANDQFGVVALSGDGNTLAMGAPMEASNSIGVDGDEINNASPNTGAVYVYARTNGVWAKQSYLKAPNTNLAAAQARFGWSLAISRDGNTLAVGAPGESSCASGIDLPTLSTACAKQGAVYVYVRSSNGWAFSHYIKGVSPDTPRNAFALLFGYSVAMSADGNTLLASAPGEGWARTGIIQGQNPSIPTAVAWGTGAGAAYVFTRDVTGSWSQQAYIKPKTAVASLQHNGNGDLRFGMAAALSSDGDTAVIGAPGESSTNGANAYDCEPTALSNCSINSGAVYVFRRDRASIDSPWSQQALIKPTDTASGLNFGGYIIAGSGFLDGSLTSAPAARVLSLSADGNTLVAGSVSSATGFASTHVFVFTGQLVWAQQAKLSVDPTSSSHGNGAAAVSTALSADGDRLAVGAGKVFTRNLGTWSQVSRLNAIDPISDAFGWSLGMSDDGRTLAVGAPGEDSNATLMGGDQANNAAPDSGAVYLY